ncbi:winged helix-turn-helix transcriptional regulator [Kitasatospora purpeofusca]|uniref:winged helix-turn-helix transcriptional regulator n=1 Tax=Kitasatospora purpeofusca TaxID=67352 RepID=UPI003677651F
MRTTDPTPSGADTAPTTAPTGTGPLSARLARGAYRRAWRHRRHLAPLYSAAALAAYGQAITLAPHGGIGALAADLALPAGVAGLRAWRKKKPYTNRAARFLHTHRALPTPPDRPMRRGELLRTSAATAAAGALVTAMPLLGTGPFEAPIAGWLWFAWLPATAGPWWWRRRIRANPGRPEAQEARAARWAAKIGSSRGALPGSVLANVRELEVDGAWAADIILDAERHTTADARMMTGRIAGALGVPIASVAVDAPADGTNDKATLLVYETNPLIEVPHCPVETALDTTIGIAVLGPHIDGSPALYQMWRPGWGAVHDHISGATGSGKSGVVTSLFAIERHADGLICSWGGDPQFGKSFGYWCDYLDYFAPGVDECLAMLLAADAELDRRSKASAFATWTDADGDLMYGETDFVPTPEEPLLVITIDEWQDVWGAYPEAIDIAVRLAILGRKCGIKLRLITHLPTLDSVGSPKLRQPLTSGNIIALRTTEKSAGHVINLPADPNDLPTTWPGMPGSTTTGIGFIKSVEARAAVFRGWRPEKKETATRWAKGGRPGTLGEESRAVCGSAYTDWRERLAARRRGETPQVPGVDIPFDGEGKDENTGAAPQSAKAGTKVRPAERIPAQTTSASAAEFANLVTAANAPARGEKKRAILAYLDERGECTSGVIAAHLAISPSTVSQTLRKAAEKGEALDLGHGKWGSARLAAAS